MRDIRSRLPTIYIWRYMALARAKDKSAGQILRAAKKELGSSLTSWPGQTISYYLGETSQEDLLKTAEDPNPTKASERKCEADLYLGEGALIAGDADRAKQHFADGIDVCPNEAVELQTIKAEMARM